ncbi:MAG TPA: DUF4340 domain-containing protein [Desulfobacteraceae bacterium]|nr:DUF4340 domain-containing protein [Desulfobacteraceae bacterium]
MKVKTLLILTALLVVLIGAGVMVIRMNAPKAPDAAMGAYLIRNLPVNEIEYITLEGPSDRVRLEKESGKWVVADRSGYPADFSRIIDFVRALREAKTGRRFEASPGTLARLSLLDPSSEGPSDENKGTRVRFLDAGERILANLLLGSPRSSGSGAASGGRYVSIEGSSAVYLIDEPLSQYKPSPADWVKKELLDIPASKIQSLACRKDSEYLYRFERDESGDPFEPVIFPSGEKVDEQVLKKLSEVPASFRIDDVLPVSQIDQSAFNTCLEYRFFDGRIMLLCPLENDEAGPLVRISAGYDRPAADKKDSGLNVQIDEETAVETAELQDIVSRWVFKLSRWRFDSLITDPAELTADEKDPAS